MTQTIEQLTARVRELEEENERLKSLATTKGAMGLLADQLKQLAAAQEEIQKLRQDLLISYGESEELSGQLAKAEQQVAEACADLLVDRFKHEVAGTLAIRQGEWRKFVKEV